MINLVKRLTEVSVNVFFYRTYAKIARLPRRLLRGKASTNCIYLSQHKKNKLNTSSDVSCVICLLILKKIF